MIAVSTAPANTPIDGHLSESAHFKKRLGDLRARLGIFEYGTDADQLHLLGRHGEQQRQSVVDVAPDIGIQPNFHYLSSLTFLSKRPSAPGYRIYCRTKTPTTGAGKR